MQRFAAVRPADSARPGCRSGCGSRRARQAHAAGARERRLAGTKVAVQVHHGARRTASAPGWPERFGRVGIGQPQAHHRRSAPDWQSGAGAATDPTAAIRVRRPRAPPHRRQPRAAMRRNWRHRMHRSPCARIAAITPVSRSPMPPTAMPGLPAAITRGVRPGAATIVPAPFNTTTHRNSTASTRAASETVGLHFRDRRRKQARGFARMRRQDRTGQRAHRTRVRQQVQGIGIEHSRLACGQRGLQQHASPQRLAEARADRHHVGLLQQRRERRRRARPHAPSLRGDARASARHARRG